MLKAKCIGKINKYSNVVMGYQIQYLETGNIETISPNELKNAIRMGVIDVINIRINQDGKMQYIENSLYDWCKQNSLYGEKIIKEFNSIKNAETGVTIYNTSCKSHKNVWWTCELCNKDWQASPAHRVMNSSGCPLCNKKQTSFIEQYIYLTFKQLFPETKNRYKELGVRRSGQPLEIDVFVPELNNLCIEYNGQAWHESIDGYERDSEKIEFCYENSLRLITIMEIQYFTEAYTQAEYGDTFIIRYKNRVNDVEEVIDTILKQYNHSISEIKNIEELRQKAYNNSHGAIPYESSIAYLYPKFAEDFIDMDPKMVTPMSNLKPNFLCKYCGNKWQAMIANRIKDKSGCPRCNYSSIRDDLNIPQKIKSDEYIRNYGKTIEELYPKFASEIINPEFRKLTPGTAQRAEFECLKCHNRWIVSIGSRTNRHNGCPKCHYSSIKEDLGIKQEIKKLKTINEMYPTFAKEIINPALRELTTGFDKETEFQCIGCGNKWVTKISYRIYDKTGCPKCRYNSFKADTGEPQKLRDTRSIEELYPTFAKEIINPEFRKLTPGSHQEIICKCLGCGMEWESTPHTRVGHKRGCPNCGFNAFKADAGEPQTLKGKYRRIKRHSFQEKLKTDNPDLYQKLKDLGIILTPNSSL